MNIAKSLLQFIIVTPNMPMICFVVCLMFCEKLTRSDIWEPQDDSKYENIYDEEMKGNIKKTFPKWFMCITSFIFYTWFTFNFIV